MLERTIKESWTLEDVCELKAKLSRLSGGGDTMSRKPFYEQCKVWVEQSEKEREEKRERYVTYPSRSHSQFFDLECAANILI
jgi:hypothetical protein